MPTSENPFTYTYFKENIKVLTWNRTDAPAFIRWYRDTPSGSKGPWDGTSFSKTFFTEEGITQLEWNKKDARAFIRWYRDTPTGSPSPFINNINSPPIGSVTIIGSPIQGEILTADDAALDDDDGLGTITYTWSTGVIGTSIVLTQADIGTAITVTASYVDAQGTEESITSEPTSLVAGIINNIVLNTTNTELRVTFMVDVYNATGGSGDLEVDDFALSILSGVATIDTTPVSITKISGSVWVLELDIPITATGNEPLKIGPTPFNSIYNGNNIAISFQSTVVLNDTRVPITDDNFGLAIAICLYNKPVSGNDIDGIHGPMSGWDVSNVTNMGSAFINKTDFNGDLSRWNVSRVNNMYGMFAAASSFNSDLSSWDVSRVNNMSDMFAAASSFNSDLSSWDVSRVNNMSGMFAVASSFNGNISSWDTSAVMDMNGMFYETSSFNGDLSMWDTSAVIDMADMFDSATAITTVFLSKTGAVTNMFRMFRNAKSLTTVILPETGAVMNMGEMFLMDVDAPNATGVSALTTVTLPKTGAVMDMDQMFYGAEFFDQDIRGWDVSKVLSFKDMFLLATAMEAKFKDTEDWTGATPTASWFDPP